MPDCSTCQLGQFSIDGLVVAFTCGGDTVGIGVGSAVPWLYAQFGGNANLNQALVSDMTTIVSLGGALLVGP